MQESVLCETKLIKEITPPLKLYRFNSAKPADVAITHLISAIDHARSRGLGETHQAIIAFLYGCKKKSNYVQGTDLFAWRNFHGEDAMLNSWTYESGVYVPQEKGTCSGTEIEILAAENRLRRAHRTNLEHYLACWPNLEGIVHYQSSIDSRTPWEKALKEEGLIKESKDNTEPSEWHSEFV